MKSLQLFLILLAMSSSTYVAASADHNDNDHAAHADEKHADDHSAKKEDKHDDDHDEHGKDDHGDHNEEAAHDDHDEGEGGHGGHGEHEEEGGAVDLSAEQMQTAGIEVETLQLQNISASIQAAGEVMLNAYRTVQVTPRIAGQVLARHARLGDEVKKGQPLVTLSSVEMAEAQGQLHVTYREWQRVKKLGKKVVSARRYTEAKVNWDQAHARALAYGMSEAEIKDMLNKNRIADGKFQLIAQQAGRVLHDKFIVGQRVEPGYELMTVADESVMWVEARLTPNDASTIHPGNAARVILGKMNLQAKVSQINHALDESTRTLAVRLEVENPDDILHPGMFINSRIQSSEMHNALVVPEAAVLRSPDGDWQVMVEQEEAGEFKPVEIELVQIINGQAVIDGIKPGTRVVTQGAFFVQSELAKSGFEIHNH